MKTLGIPFLFLSVLTLSITSCSKDEPNEETPQFGTISLRISIDEGSPELTKRIQATAAPSQAVITYVNNGEEFSEGPEQTVQSDNVHTIVTTDDASNLNVGLNGITLDGEEINVAYTVTVSFNGTQVEQRDFAFESDGFTHTLGWSSENGFFENLVNP